MLSVCTVLCYASYYTIDDSVGTMPVDAASGPPQFRVVPFTALPFSDVFAAFSGAIVRNVLENHRTPSTAGAAATLCYAQVRGGVRLKMRRYTGTRALHSTRAARDSYLGFTWTICAVLTCCDCTPHAI